MWEVKLKVVSVCTYISLLLGAILWHLVIIKNIKYNVVFVRCKKKENVRPLPSYLLPIPAAKWKCLVQFTAALRFSIYYVQRQQCFVTQILENFTFFHLAKFPQTQNFMMINFPDRHRHGLLPRNQPGEQLSLRPGQLLQLHQHLCGPHPPLERDYVEASGYQRTHCEIGGQR